jgi:Protein of unknown function (DUF1203)
MQQQAARAQQVPQKMAHLRHGGPKDDANAMVVANQLVDGNEVDPALEKMLSPSNVDYLHIHFAAAGCFAVKVQRA